MDNLNTSHVLIYLKAFGDLRQHIKNLNTSHVLIYQNPYVQIKIPKDQFKYISCSYLSLFNTGKQKIKKI